MAWDTVSTSSSLQNRLFLLTRWRLAGIYASVVGLICTLAGFILYHAIAHTGLAAIDRELESVASTLHDSLEPSLVYPNRVRPDAQKILPSLCTDGIGCLTRTAVAKSHSTNIFDQSNYYLRLLDTSGNLVAVTGFHPTGLPILLEQDTWQILQNRDGRRYRQISLSLHPNKNLLWGYIHVGRSLEDFDRSLAYLQLILLAGIPIGIIVIGASAWWFSGVTIQPIYSSYLKMRQFTADAAHELRTPIATIQATMENKSQIEQPWSEQEIENALTTIERQNNRLSRLVEDLLLLSRMENPAKTLHKQQALVMKLSSCNLNELVSDVVEGFSILKIAATLKLTADIRVRQALYAIGDEEHLGRLISNLASNAMQYTPPGGRVTIVLDRHEHCAIIQVVDTGIGIASEHQARIFDRFYRVNSDRSRQSGGTGLGLAIAQAIVQAHHGSIQVQSELGRGSTFTVRLPLN
ncbi:MAG: Adaptive-response sensory-kinase SasA [Chroococcidiopsis cubana SAG 39.79]|uniref:histidine kinase n=1 Tax=Chroococcidiopsis cubana SAG 39.79 TaxID=388085 RepID=A0AB37US07_9CYAN|nr:two-component system sensor histidine kinase RppB [Chroococcidiopsis cubana]MDZ4877883.1 Adaptive-response sensory-kinase SasA [Chroococcidiopsis cubana SAG 39.79]PSB54594.1 two-component sensor histidine kinase [Chroococcidiopsis cubana CCALA 043]RUT14152.1 two-component sensor histidine kinase [Chroococcidiopsis cubana SAG 39.79]